MVCWDFADIDLYGRNYPIVGTNLSCLSSVGFAYAFPKLNIRTDISYTWFIYHMIVVNVFIELGLTEGV